MATRKAQITGRWRITSMTEWNNDFVDAEVPGCINFAKDGLGDFQFGYVRCGIDWRESERDEASGLRFSLAYIFSLSSILPLMSWAYVEQYPALFWCSIVPVMLWSYVVLTGSECAP
jgi:hypothetical protein